MGRGRLEALAQLGRGGAVPHLAREDLNVAQARGKEAEEGRERQVTPSRALTHEDFARAAEALDVEPAAIRAVAEVEAAGAGFLADGRPAILYEAHVFHAETRGAHSHAKDRRGVALSSPHWNRSLYG